MVDEELQRPTPEQVRRALDVLLNASAEQVDQALIDLRSAIEGGPSVVVHGSKAESVEHALSGSASITFTASATLSFHEREVTDPLALTDLAVPSALVQAASRPVDDVETAASIVMLYLALGALSSAAAGRLDISAIYLSALETLRELLRLLRRG